MSDLPPLANLCNLVMRVICDYPNVNWRDAFSRGQLASKLWLIGELSRQRVDLGNVLVVGGWLGVMPMLLFADTRVQTGMVRSIDKDPQCSEPADRLNRFQLKDDWRFKAFTADACDMTYAPVIFTKIRKDGSKKVLKFMPDTIINTSMEHFTDPDDWFARLPSGLLVALQVSADPSYEDHVSTVATLEAFRMRTPMKQEMFAGTRSFGGHVRHMRIGVV